MPHGVTFTQASPGVAHTVALAAGGAAHTWGRNNCGQLGDGTDADRGAPVQVLTHTTVTGVSFGGAGGSNLVDNGDGTWTVATPPHADGSVDVIVSWARNGIAQRDITYAGAFTYVVASTLTDPSDQTVTADDAVVFSVYATGTPEPTLEWQFSTDDGATWAAVTADDGVVRADGKSLTVATTEALSGNQYRAVATNSVDAATSAAATLTVTPAPTIRWEISADERSHHAHRGGCACSAG